MFQAGLSSYRRSRFGWLGLGLVAVVWLTLAPIAAAEAAAGQRPELSAEIEAVRSALEKFNDPLVAVANGYFSTVGCVQYGDGGMGVHFLNAALLGPVPDPLAPPILLYEPLDGGELHLVAVEWFVPLATGVKESPVLFGRTFEGPMAGTYPVAAGGTASLRLPRLDIQSEPGGPVPPYQPDGEMCREVALRP